MAEDPTTILRSIHPMPSTLMQQVESAPDVVANTGIIDNPLPQFDTIYIYAPGTEENKITSQKEVNGVSKYFLLFLLAIPAILLLRR